jgi:predicted GH43/DUF377 family glycosyl hydrolase
MRFFKIREQKIERRWKFQPLERERYIIKAENSNVHIFNPAIHFKKKSEPLTITLRVVGPDGLRKLADVNLNISMLEETNYISESNLNYIKSDLKFIADPRAFEWEGEYHLIANTGHSSKINEILIASRQNEANWHRVKMLHQRRGIEKNWSLISGSKEKLFIYSFSPRFTIGRLKKSNFRYYSELLSSKKIDLTTWQNTYGEIRGGTSIVKIRDYYVCVFQSNVCLPIGQVYFSGIMLLEHDTLRPHAITIDPIINPFDFEHLLPNKMLNQKVFRCTYPTSLFKLDDERIAIGYGIHDYCVGLDVYKINDVFEHLAWHRL